MADQHYLIRPRKESNHERTVQPGLFIGIDWADKKHDCYVIDQNGNAFHQEFRQSPEDIDTWIGEMLKSAGGRPIAIMLEQSNGPLAHALMLRDKVLLYPINPKQLARFRESYPGGGKDVPTDAKYLARMLRERITTLTPWQTEQNWIARIVPLLELPVGSKRPGCHSDKANGFSTRNISARKLLHQRLLEPRVAGAVAVARAGSDRHRSTVSKSWFDQAFHA